MQQLLIPYGSLESWDRFGGLWETIQSKIRCRGFTEFEDKDYEMCMLQLLTLGVSAFCMFWQISSIWIWLRLMRRWRYSTDWSWSFRQDAKGYQGLRWIFKDIVVSSFTRNLWFATSSNLKQCMTCFWCLWMLLRILDFGRWYVNSSNILVKKGSGESQVVVAVYVDNTMAMS